MLAQILPGFRDFRTPLVTGYLWLLSLWILLGKPIPTKDRKDGLMGMLNALSEYLSPLLVVGVLSFAAYLVGVMLAVDIKVVGVLIQRHGWTISRSLSGKGKLKLKFSRNSKLNDYDRIMGTSSGSTMRRLLWDAFSRVNKRLVPWETIYSEYDINYPTDEQERKYYQDALGDPDRVEEHIRRTGLGFIGPVLLSDMEAEIPIMATKLQEKNKDLYDAYSKDKAEAEFRLSVALPIAVASVLILFVGLSGNPTLNTSMAMAGFISALILFKKGWTKSQEATNIIVTHLEIKTIKSRVLERLDELQGPPIYTQQADPIIR